MQVSIRPPPAQVGMMIETSPGRVSARLTRQLPATAPGSTSPAMPRRASARRSAAFASARAIGAVLGRRLAQHRRDVPDRLGRLGAAQDQIVFARREQPLVAVGDGAQQRGPGAPQPADVIARQQQVRRPLRLKKRRDRARGRIMAALVAVEEIGRRDAAPPRAPFPTAHRPPVRRPASAARHRRRRRHRFARRCRPARRQ